MDTELLISQEDEMLLTGFGATKFGDIKPFDFYNKNK